MHPEWITEIHASRRQPASSEHLLSHSYHPTSAPEKALRRPSAATLYPGSMKRMCERGRDAADPTTSDGAARQTEDVVWRTTVPGMHVRAGSWRAFRRELPGKLRGVATPGLLRRLRRGGRCQRPAPRRPPQPGEQQASEGRRRLLRIDDGRRCGEKSHTASISVVELAGVATLGVIIIDRSPLRVCACATEGWK